MSGKRLIFIFISSFLLAGCTLPFAGNKAGIQVTATPQANVFLDGKSMGQTPVYQEDVKAGTYTVKVASSDTTLPPWEGKVTLNGGVLTIVDRQLSSETGKSNGYSLFFEKLTNKTATDVSIISSPDTVSVTIDGAPVGFTPFKSDAVAAGAHTFTLTATGYQDKVVKAKVIAGYRLVINAQLGIQTITPTPTPTPVSTISATPTVSASPTPKVDITPLPKVATSSAVAKPYVEISSTPTGWLKVRAEASTSAAEIAKVNPGDRFPYLDISGSWYQIEYLKGKQGWVSSQYATLVK